MLRKFIAASALALFAAASFANSTTIDTSGLTAAQVAEIKAITARKVAEVAADSKPVSAEQVTAGVTLAATWGQQAAAAAEGFAKAMGIAAKELNVTINDFLKSDAGKLTAILIIWKLAGAAILKALYGMLFVAVGLTMVRVIYIRLFTRGYEKVEYSRFGGFFKGTRMVRIPKSFQDLENDGEWLAFWVMIALTLATLFFGGLFF
jgi:hypothetical protein